MISGAFGIPMLNNLRYVCCIFFNAVLPILKENFTRLCQCLPQDYMETVDKLKQPLPGVPVHYLDWLREFLSTELNNEAIIGNVMCGIEADDDVFVFCDFMEKLCDEVTSKNIIEILRNGKLTK